MRQRSLRDILAAFPGKRLLILGDVMLDEYIWGEVRRISPEAPVPVVEIRRRTYIPGGAANTAANVVSLGGCATLAGVVGQDQEADRLVEALREHGVGTEGLVVDSEGPTTTKTRIVAHSQQVVRLDCERQMPVSVAIEETLLRWLARHIPNADACILSDYNKGVVSSRLAEHFILLARHANKLLIVDPKGTQYAKYRGATVITPNVSEVQQALAQPIDSDADLLQAGQQLLDCLQGTAVLITRGPLGMTLFVKGAPSQHIPAMAQQVFDVTGAGDTAVSTLAMALAADATLEQATLLANCAAGIVVGKVGTATVSLAELTQSPSLAER